MKSKLLAVGEVILVFALFAVVFRTMAASDIPPTWNLGTFGPRIQVALAYLAVLLVLLILWLLLRRDGPMLGLVFQPARYHLAIFTRAFIPVFLLSANLGWISWKTWPGAVLISIIEIGLLVWIAWALRRQLPVDMQKAAVVALAVPLLGFTGAKAGTALFNLVYFYLIVAPVEELLFRGYALGRLNQAFDRPWNLMGTRFGAGLFISALLFGLWHAVLQPGNLSVYPQVLWTFFAGLMFGIVREKSGSIAAPALLHGVLNYGPQALIFGLFF